MELTYDFETDAPKEVLLKYVLDPNNLLKYVPAFKGLKQIDNNTWELDIKWLFTLKLTVKREILNDEVDYNIEKTEGLIKISSYLRYVILTSKSKNTLRIIFFYKGPFESVVKKQTEEYYKKGKEMFEKDLQKLEETERPKHVTVSSTDINIEILKMKTILAKEINKEEVENIIEQAMINSINSKVVLLLSDDDNNMVHLTFVNGSLEEVDGDINKLGNNIKVIMKKA